MKCAYYDDGVGNGSYIPGSCCGPPGCGLSKKPITPQCNGEFSKCELGDKAIAEAMRHSAYLLNLDKLRRDSAKRASKY